MPDVSRPGMIRSYGETDFITGIRAIAATMVVVIHTGAFSGWGSVGDAITSAGKYGVDVFFVVSGFTIAKTIADAQDYRSYLMRRLFRIVPLYWATITFAFLLASFGLVVSTWMTEFAVAPDLRNLLMHFAFVSFLDYRVANSLIGVEWTIPVEVFWYIFLPFLLPFAQGIWRLILMCLGLLLVAVVIGLIAKQVLGTTLPVRWSPIAYAHYFLIGSFAYSMRWRLQASDGRSPALACWLAVFIAILCLVLNFPGRGELLSLMVAVLLASLTPSGAKGINSILTWRPLLFVGSISYSVYLLHMISIALLRGVGIEPKIGLVNFLVVYILTLVLSALTYRLIERPSNEFGRRYVQGLEPQNRAS